jgi:hypothetical protein
MNAQERVNQGLIRHTFNYVTFRAGFEERQRFAVQFFGIYPFMLRQISCEIFQSLAQLPVSPGGKPWQIKFQGYEHEDVLTQSVKTDAEGNAEFTFTAAREGYYRVAWSSLDTGGAPITAETTVWVATGASTDLGYRHGGLEIIVDKDTFRAGRRPR